MDSIKIGKVIQIEGLKLLIQITEDVSAKLTVRNDVADFIISINKLICSNLPCGKLAISKIVKIFDQNLRIEEIFRKGEDKYLIESILIGIFDKHLNKFDSGINTFPIIGSEVYGISKNIYSRVLEIDSKYKLQIGESYNDLDIKVYADPDILLGKHLAVIGNTGTGKSCSVASIIQGLKRRLCGPDGQSNVATKILIFDSNNEYNRAFSENEFTKVVIKKEDLKLPHYFLNFYEYYKFVGASQGVQAPVLKQAIKQLKKTGVKFKFGELPAAIEDTIKSKSNYDSKDTKTHFSYNQWMGWASTMINRIEQLNEDERFNIVTKADETEIKKILDGNDEVVIFETDFDKDVLDVVMFLFSKIVYQWAQDKKKENGKGKNVLLVLEEAHRYINEEENDEYKLGNYYIERLAREGRKFGISLIISSQRPSELSKTVLSQCNSFIIHRITNKADLDFISRLLTIADKELLNIISGIEKQYAIVTGEAFGYSELIKITTASPTPKSDDPKVIDSWLKA